VTGKQIAQPIQDPGPKCAKQSVMPIIVPAIISPITKPDSTVIKEIIDQIHQNMVASGASTT
jgi:hypothetical protein